MEGKIHLVLTKLEEISADIKEVSADLKEVKKDLAAHRQETEIYFKKLDLELEFIKKAIIILDDQNVKKWQPELTTLDEIIKRTRFDGKA
jgi:hypothetical protein